MTRIAWFVAAVTLFASGVYVFIYLYRWEWHRALFVAVLFLATEVAMATLLLLRRIGERPPAERRRVDPRVATHLRAAAPRRDRFAWLEGDLSRTNVFLTVLLGGGVVVSAGAWVLDRVASRTIHPGLEQSLAARLAPLAPPDGGLVADDAELAASGEGPDAAAVRLLLGPTVSDR
ncbi:MAG TPA: hypothetical protein VFZ68_14060 [Acidimicrobiales bacterium]